MIAAAVAASAARSASARVSAATDSTASGSRPSSRNAASMRVRTRSLGTCTALNSPLGNRRGSSWRIRRSLPKKTIAATNGPATKVMPNIWRNARPRSKSPVSSGQNRPQMNAAATQPPPLASATNVGSSSARRRAVSPAGPGGSTVPARVSGASQRFARCLPMTDSSPKAITK